MSGKIPNTLIENINSREPVRVKAKTPLLAVVMAMKEGQRGAAIIEDNAGKIIGIFTERDLIAELDHSSQDWHDIPVDKIMIKNIKTIKVSHYIHEALAIMITCKFRHLPIVDSDNHVLGIVSIRDIIMYVASLYPQEFLNLPPDPGSVASDQYGG